MAEAPEDVKEEAVETPSASSTEVKPPEDTPEGAEEAPSSETPPSEGAGEAEEEVLEATPEEARKRQYVPYERFQRVLNENKELKSQSAVSSEQVPDLEEYTPEQIEQAKRFFRAVGVLTKEEVNQRLQAIEDKAQIKEAHTEAKHWVEEHPGWPKYDEKEVEAFMMQSGIFDNRAAYRIMHDQEITNWHIEKALEGNKGIASEKPVKTGIQSGKTNVLTREAIDKMTPQEWEENREEIMRALLEGQIK